MKLWWRKAKAAAPAAAAAQPVADVLKTIVEACERAANGDLEARIVHTPSDPQLARTCVASMIVRILRSAKRRTLTPRQPRSAATLPTTAATLARLIG